LQGPYRRRVAEPAYAKIRAKLHRSSRSSRSATSDLTRHPSMNLAALLVVLASLAGLMLRRQREGALVWCVCGLAAAALFAPALRLPDGVPSPAATLALDAPWQAVASPAAGNDNLRDITYQVEPWLLYLRSEVRLGRLPLWNPYQAAGSTYWSNGSSAPLFPLHLLFVITPLQLGWVLLPWLRLVIAGVGAAALARELGVSRSGALLAALTFALCGTVASFVLFPMSNVQALLPWVFLAVERLAKGTWGLAPLALLGGLQLLGGHPETALYTALLTAIYLAVRGPKFLLRTWMDFSVGWALAAAIAAVELLPLAATLPHTSRWLAWQPPDAVPFPTVLALWSRLLLPEAWGSPAKGTWWGPYNYAATAIYAGAAALVLAPAGAWARRRDRRWLGVIVMTLFATCAAYQLPGARQLMLALPVLGHGLHHYIKIGLEVGLALLAGAGFDRWREGRWRPLALAAGIVVLLLAFVRSRYEEAWELHRLAATEAHWMIWVAALVAIIAATAALPAAWRSRLAPVVLLLALCDLVAAHTDINPGLSAAAIYPQTPAIGYLVGKPGRVAATGGTLHPNAGMVYGLFDVRGDDSIKLVQYEQLYAQHLGQGSATFFLPMNRWQDPWLDRLGVRWVLTRPQEAPPAPGWTARYSGPDARVWERPTPLPVVHWLGPPPEGAALSVDRSVPGSWDLSWHSPTSATIEVAEIWDTGWHAAGDRGPLPVQSLDGRLLGVTVGPGDGHLQLRYRPDGFLPGLALSLAGLAGTAFVALRRRRPSAPSEPV
jgi:hypothetical protein